MPPIAASIVLVLAGFACIFLELVIPSAGVVAVVSGTLLVSGIVVGFSAGFIPGAIIMGVTIVALPIVVMFLIQIWPNTPIGRRIFSALPRKEDVEPDQELVDSLESLIGKNGVSRSKLLPAGSITIDGKHYDAVSDGLPIEKDQKVTVVSVKAQRIFVRPMMQTTDEGSVNTLQQSIESLGLESIDDPLEN